MTRKLIFKAHGREGPNIVMTELDRLEKLYLATMKRKLSIEVFVSDGSMNGKSYTGLTAYFKPEQKSEVDFLIQNIT